MGGECEGAGGFVPLRGELKESERMRLSMWRSKTKDRTTVLNVS